jgi:hypothetical protein
MRIRSAILEEKPSVQTSYPSSIPLLDAIGQRNYDATTSVSVRPDESNPPTARDGEVSGLVLPCSVVSHGRWVGIGNIQCDFNALVSIEEETLACFKKLRGKGN